MMRQLASFAVVTVFLAWPAAAGPIEQACLRSERSQGQSALCGCIQDAANMTLTEKDQKLAASFFDDPHRAQEVRQSKSSRMEKFWERYENFSVAAESFCSR